MDTTLTEDIDLIFGESDTAVSRDLKLNLKRILNDGALTPDESFPVLLALSTATQYRELSSFVELQLRNQHISEEKIREAKESAAIMSMLNVYYKFKHMLHKDDEYRQTGLRMTALANPISGKKQFEMMAFAISVLSGCETCIQAHEKVLRDSEVSVDKIHDLARLAAVVKALEILNHI